LFLVSKAFTRESDQITAEPIIAVRTPLPPGARNYITREGAERLRNQLNELSERRRALSVKAAESDPEVGSELPSLETAVRRLQLLLDSVVVAEIPAEKDKIAFGASVRIRRPTGEEECYQVVGVDEADPAAGRISWISPLARALMNHRAGDTVYFRAPGGDDELSVLSVEYQG
jgi:transcription elongation factor GreB